MQAVVERVMRAFAIKHPLGGKAEIAPHDPAEFAAELLRDPSDFQLLRSGDVQSQGRTGGERQRLDGLAAGVLLPDDIDHRHPEAFQRAHRRQCAGGWFGEHLLDRITALKICFGLHLHHLVT